MLTITNEQAMQDLQETKAKRDATPIAEFSYWHGLLVGKAITYSKLGVLSVDQYMQVTEFVTTPA